jgi:hypothetical protein
MPPMMPKFIWVSKSYLEGYSNIVAKNYYLDKKIGEGKTRM